MAASTITVRPSPIDIARAAAAAMPAEVSSKPLLGILGVVTGAGVITLTSLMISLGMREFRGLYGFWCCPVALDLYGACVDGAVDIAPSLYGWYREHLSSNWMFWNSALITPLMMICIYYGIPKANAPKKSGKAPSFAGFLYASAGLAMLLVACEQGERLDWWRSGVFNALFAGGSVLPLCALVRRLRGPNPLVALPYLLKWNTVLLGSLLFWFRFTLFTP